MFTSIRTVLMCDKVEQGASGLVDCFGLHGPTLHADSKPGLVKIWLFMMVETDGRASTGAIRLQAADYAVSFPLSGPAGETLVASAIPLMVPVTKAGPLAIFVDDDDRKAKRLRARWALEFAQGATVLEDGAAQDFIDAGLKAAEMVVASVQKSSLN